MVRIRGLFLVIALAMLCPPAVLAQSPPQFFLVCGSQPNLPTVYVSGVLQGPAATFQGFRNGFTTYLGQRYGYQGAVGCLPATTAANAQNILNQRTAVLRNQKKNVVETGWTEPALVAAASAAVPPLPAARQAAAGAPAGSAAPQPQPQPSAAAGSSNSGTGASPLSSILGAVLSSAGSSHSNAATAGAATTGSAGTAGNNQSGAAQPVSSASADTSTAGAPSSSQQDAPQVLGSAQAQNTKLLVYGCARQDTQVACLTELVNQNHQDTLVQAKGMWKDAFIVDDRGDRHPRSGAFFLNVDGDQRPQLDISYGKSAQFVLMFDDVQTKVQKVTLRSTTGGLDVEDIGLVMPDNDAQGH